MAAKITSDMINRRLGATLNQQPARPSYEEPYEEAIEADDDDDKMSAGFIATMVATCLVLGLGTFFVIGNGSSIFDWNLSKSGGVAFASKVDSICKPLWKTAAWNDEALACYMIEAPERFCNEGERDHLVSLLGQYRLDAERLKAKVLSEFSANRGKIMADIQKSIDNFDKPEQAQYSPSQVRKPKPKPSKYLKQRSFEENIASFQKKVMDPSARNQNLELSDLLRALIVKGYFQHRYEFGMLNDQIVSDAYAEAVPKVKSPCPGQAEG